VAAPTPSVVGAVEGVVGGVGPSSPSLLPLGLGIQSDRTDRFGSSVFFKIRSSKNKDRSVSSKNEDRLIRFWLFRFGLRL
jgi:hypothetical protein